VEQVPKSRAYSEFGWKTVDIIGVDLAKWDKDERGGAYQVECMLRRPGEIESSGGVVEE
jgi:hypothetical protein